MEKNKRLLKKPKQNMIREELFFRNNRGQKIAAVVYRPDDNLVERHSVVLFSHGYNANYRMLEHHGEEYAREGFVCIFYDFCGGSLDSYSEGSMLEMTVDTEVNDLCCVMEQAAELSYVDANNMFLQGESMGGFVSALVAARFQQKVKGLILWYPAFVIPDGSRQRLACGETTCFGIPLSPNFDSEAKDIDIFNIIREYKGPVRIIHGDKDTVVPLSYSERALESFDNASMLVIPGAGHGYNDADSKTARRESIDFCKKCAL